MIKIKKYKMVIDACPWNSSFDGHLEPVDPDGDTDDNRPWVEECSDRKAVIAGLKAIAKVMKWRIVA
jgi:hypothetical protein